MDGHGVLDKQYSMPPTRVLIQDPCPFGSLMLLQSSQAVAAIEHDLDASCLILCTEHSKTTQSHAGLPSLGSPWPAG